MPLAIELAAARMAPGRHRSLAAAVEWSYRLLEEHERRVFGQLSVFAGLRSGGTAGSVWPSVQVLALRPVRLGLYGG